VKPRPLLLAALILLASVVSDVAAAETDARSFELVVHRSESPRSVSVRVELRDAAHRPDDGIRAPTRSVELWQDLHLRIVPLAHVDVSEGVFAYAFQLVRDAAGDEALLPTDQPGHGISADVVAAFHFRDRDNSGPNVAGPGNLNAPGPLRHISYSGLDVTIRVLDLEILHAARGETPSLGALTALVVVSEVVAREPEGDAP